MNKLIKVLVIVHLLLGSNIVKGQSQTAFYCPPCNSSCDVKVYGGPGVCDHCGMKFIEMTREERMKNAVSVAFYLQDGVEVLDFAGPMEVFVYAGFQVFTVSATTDPITSLGVLKVTPDFSIDNAPHADILVFFGGNTKEATENPAVMEWVKNQTDVDYYFSVCSGAFVLAEGGLLDGKTATTFHSSIERLRTNYPEVEVLDNVRYVDNGNVVTTAGVSAGIDGALHMVAKLKGLKEAQRIVEYMEYDKWKPGEGLILSKDNPYEVID